jgi:hypothetical protein
MFQAGPSGSEVQAEGAVINWIKINGLLFFTFGLIAIMWVIRYLLFLFAVTLSST